jgi:hypothetical protein
MHGVVVEVVVLVVVEVVKVEVVVVVLVDVTKKGKTFFQPPQCWASLSLSPSTNTSLGALLGHDISTSLQIALISGMRGKHSERKRPRRLRNLFLGL